MGTVLYEVRAGLPGAVWLPVLFALTALLIPRIRKKTVEDSGAEYTPELRSHDRALSLLAVLFGLLAGLIVWVFQSDMHDRVVGAYESGSYEIVEGYVENYAFPASSRTSEAFEIGGVYFEYSDCKTITGYHKTRSKGGVITGDGQYLRVGYVYFNEIYGNIIVYIEEFETPET